MDYEFEDEDTFEKFRRTKDHTMPAGSEVQRAAGRKKTYRSARAAKRTARETTGIRKRRNKKWDIHR